ncbi:MAG: hypothetical protein MMC33_002345 [Icmadophila ericetorum]|nr:hypothetical protein [Icmadophila ericetorum]
MHFSTRLLVSLLAASLCTSGELLPRQKSEPLSVESGLLPSASSSSVTSQERIQTTPSTSTPAAAASTSTDTSTTFAVGVDTSGTQPVTRTTNSVSVETHASTSASGTTEIGGQAGGQAGGQGTAGVGEATNTLQGALPGQTSSAGAWRAVQTVGAGVLGMAVAVQALL